MGISKTITHKDAIRLDYEEFMNGAIIRRMDYSSGSFSETRLSVPEIEVLMKELKNTLWKIKEKRERKERGGGAE